MKPLGPDRGEWVSPQQFTEGPKALPVPFVDDRGEIQPLLSTPVNDVALIRSQAGKIRGNHYHKTDSHYCYVLSGRMHYYYRPVGSADPPKMIVIEPGQMIFTPFMTEHAMYFPEETVFLCMAHNVRTHEQYEADVVRIELI